MNNSTVNNNAMKEPESEWMDVCSFTDLTPYDGVCALLKGRQIALFRFANEEDVYAIENYDPIGKASVLSRGFMGDIEGRKVIASPLYKHHFDLQTGECLEKPETVLDVYPARVVDGRVQIKL